MADSLEDQRLPPQRVTSEYLPVQNSSQSIWQQEAAELAAWNPTSPIPQEADVVIIGAGYAGVATAYHLLKKIDESGGAQKRLSISIFDARGPCSGATGRNGGHLRPDLYGRIPTHMARSGVAAGSEIAAFEIANLRAIEKVIEEENIDCDLKLARVTDVWCNPEAAQRAKANYDVMVNLNLDYMKDVCFNMGEEAEEISGVKGARACASYTAGQLSAYKFIVSLLKSMVDAGRVDAHSHTPVTEILPAKEGGFLVKTPSGTVFARQVVHASNGYVAGLLPEYSRNIIPCKGVCCHIDVPQGAQRPPSLPGSYINRASDHMLSYLISRDNGSIVVGGKASMLTSRREQWYHNVDDGADIDGAKGFYSDYMQKTYRGWEESQAEITKIWTGVMGYSFDTNPHVGVVPGRPGQFILAGFNGHGMPVIFLAAQGLAALILSDKTLTCHDVGVPRLFQTSRARIEVAQQYAEEDGDILGTGRAFSQATHSC